jgi:hypothetical protein
MWSLAMVLIAAAAFVAGVPPTDLFTVDRGGELRGWQALAVGISVSTFGWYFVNSTRIGSPRSNEIVQSLQRYVKLTGWVFGVGGALIAFLAIAELSGWLQH